MKLLSRTLLFSMLLIASASAMSVDYYFHPQCSHCQAIEPFIQQAYSKYQNVDWNILDTSKQRYEISGTPYLEIKTDDDRIIELSGSQEIPAYLECELNEMSTQKCKTYSSDNCMGESWFIR